MNGAPANPISGRSPSSATSRRTASVTYGIWSVDSSRTRSRSAAVRIGSAITGPVPGTMSRSTPAAFSGTMMSE